jgi:hypothetical protein
MKRLMTLALIGTILAVSSRSGAWVAYHGAGYGHVGYGGACWHGGWSCGGVSTGTAVAAGLTGLAAGAIIGSSIARANTPTYVVGSAPVVYAPAPVVLAPSVPIGSIYYSLPYGVQSANINGVQYYVLGGTYYRPYFGNNGVYYQVVPNPV